MNGGMSGETSGGCDWSCGLKFIVIDYYETTGCEVGVCLSEEWKHSPLWI